MRRTTKYFYKKRFFFLIFLFIACVLALMSRMVYLTVVDRDFLQTQGNARTIRTVTIPAYRGIITDRNGQPLAVSTPVQSVWICPQEFAPTKQQYFQLVNLLSLDPSAIAEKIKRFSTKEFLYLVRGVDPQTAEQVKALKIPGVFLQQEFRRYYPEAAITSHLIGFTNIDDFGQEGLELYYDEWLRGVPGKKRVLKDRFGNVVTHLGVIKPSRPGHNLALSIDRRIQFLAHQELEKAIEKYKAKTGSIVVLDINTGEVLAMVNYPTFNPNQRPLPISDDGRYRNRAETDLFEPGSVIKAFSVANGIEGKVIKPMSMIDTRPGFMTLDGNLIRDIHSRGVMSVIDVLKHSSNIGVSKITLMMPPDSLYNLLRRVGFGETTGSSFPGEREGTIVHPPKWRPFGLATLSFGYGISVTPLQLARAYAVIGAKGLKKPVSLLKLQQPQQAERVLSPEVADTMLSILENVVDDKDGSGHLAQVPGYRIAGKTGTARMLSEKGGYEEKHHIASFVGIVPASNPKLVIAVVVQDPSEDAYYASLVAAPVFAQVAGGALSILNIPPDNLVQTAQTQ